MSCHSTKFPEQIPYGGDLRRGEVFAFVHPALDAAAYRDRGRSLPCGPLPWLPFRAPLAVCGYSLEPAFVQKRNERERHRVRCVNEGYARLREHLPPEVEDKRLSKVETLRAAIDYIKHLQRLLGLHSCGARGEARGARTGSGETSSSSSSHSGDPYLSDPPDSL